MVCKKPAALVVADGAAAKVVAEPTEDEAAQPAAKVSASEKAVMAVAAGSKDRVHVQGVMNHLKRLASKTGSDGALQAYKKCKNNVERRDFVHKLSLDFDASFVTATEEQEVEKEIAHEDLEGWAYPWDVAVAEGIPWVDENKRLVNAICQGLQSKDADTEALQAEGYKQFWYSKKKLKKRSTRAKRK